MATKVRTTMTNVRMSGEEVAMLKRLAVQDGLSASDVVRQLVRRAHDDRFGPIAQVVATVRVNGGSLGADQIASLMSLVGAKRTRAEVEQMAKLAVTLGMLVRARGGTYRLPTLNNEDGGRG